MAMKAADVMAVLVRLSDRFTPRQLAALHEEHTASGAHQVVEQPFPEWVAVEVQHAAEKLSAEDALDQLPPFLTSGPTT